MDNLTKKEKRKQYYLDNRERILERNKKYYYDNIEIRKEYNRNYWDINKDKYLERRSNDSEYKAKHRLYYHNYYKINHEVKVKDIPIINNNITKSLTVYFN
jgi:hypothetical protein